METIYLVIVILLLTLAVFDLTVGVSNDAVNFLNSAIGSKTASFKIIIAVAAIGVFFGASMSNGMMEIARHGIFKPEYYLFSDLMYIFMAVIVTDIILLDIFNTMGMPTSTTVSMVFELLGASCTTAIVKAFTLDNGISVADYINTDKALSVILGIFISVAIAFFFGTLVQYICRILFTFSLKRNIKYKIGIFGGLSVTAIIYFMLIKGTKDMSFMTDDVKMWIAENTMTIVAVSLVVFTLISQLLHAVGVSVFKMIVLLGTFSLAMAFAGNDLVNFIGVPLAGFSSYGYYAEAGFPNPSEYVMSRLNEPAQTPVYFLVGAGLIMVVALATSKKAHNVVKTSVDLARQDEGEEMFGSSRTARRIVRLSTNVANWFVDITPDGLRRWINNRFDVGNSDMPEGAAFDQLRASVNLVLAGLLVALGTSLKLPLSTTYVTFMVAMGSSLADRAWGRESAVFRITGVLSVIGGWLLTAAAAFLLCSIVVLAMRFGGIYVALAIAFFAMFILIRSNIMYKRRQKLRDAEGDQIFQDILHSKDKMQTWHLLQKHIELSQKEFLEFICDRYCDITRGFMDENLKQLRRSNVMLPKEKALLKSIRRKQTLALRRVEPRQAIENNTWLHLSYNNSQQMVYCLMRMCEPCLEHVDNNFAAMPVDLKEQYEPIRKEIFGLLDESRVIVTESNYDATNELRRRCDDMKSKLSSVRKELVNHIHEDMNTYSVIYVYLNMLQESQEMISSLRHMLRALRKIERED
ncbi:MAG: inorganic phosphate transporter [Marinilabiliaceae bacterium]|nr:inorganic phosphate transporter [Marinilabiliaceae bacterium]